MEISKTKIKFNAKRKTSSLIIDTLNLALKQKNWLPIAKIISSSKRKYSKVNLEDIEKQTSVGDTVIVIGKVLSQGEITKRMRVCAFGFSSFSFKY